MASPVLHKMMSGSFSEGLSRRFYLEDVDGEAFEGVLNLWCGKEGRAEQLGDVMVMASVADRLEMLDVLAVLEAAIIGELRAEVCAEVLMSSRRLGLGLVVGAAWGWLCGGSARCVGRRASWGWTRRWWGSCWRRTGCA